MVALKPYSRWTALLGNYRLSLNHGRVETLNLGGLGENLECELSLNHGRVETVEFIQRLTMVREPWFKYRL